MHFTKDNYDYFKYNAKVRANPQSFETRKDKFFFYKLSKKEDLLNFYVANMLEKPDVWAGELVTDKCKDIYDKWKKHHDALTYNFTLEVRDLYPDFDEQVKVKGGQHPPLYKLYRQGLLSIESLIILDEIYNIFEYWNREIADPVLWPKTYMLCKKYKGFLHYDIKKFKNALKKIIASA
jgi:hypothetical protein